MGVHVDGEGGLPGVLVGLDDARAHPHAGIGEEEIDRPEHLGGGLDQGLVAGLGADIGGHPDGTVERRSHRIGALEVGDHQSGALGVEGAGERLADPSTGTRDHDVLPLQLHGPESYASRPNISATRRSCELRIGTARARPARRVPCKAMTDQRSDTTNEAVINEALSVIDGALAKMMRRELVSSGEVADLLLDVRTLLTAEPVSLIEIPEPVASESA